MNNIVLVGRLVADPELRYTPNNVAVASIKIAVDRAGTKAPNKVTDFISCVAWRQSAEFASNYLKKGRLVAIEGSLNIDEFLDKERSKRREAKVVINRINALDRGPDSDHEGSTAKKSFTSAPVDMSDISDPFSE